MAYQLTCPCGALIFETDVNFLPAVRKHLHDAHPGRDYPDEAILMMSVKIPDAALKKRPGPAS